VADLHAGRGVVLDEDEMRAIKAEARAAASERR
jgi:hypothetical protein